MATAFRALVCTLCLGLLLFRGTGRGERTMEKTGMVPTCSLRGDRYPMGSNKSRLREFLEENGGLGLQVILPKGGFMCAKNMEDEELGGLVEYLEVVRPILRREKNGVWAVKREKMSPDG